MPVAILFLFYQKMEITSMKLDIKIAQSDSERMEAYKLRYRVYIQEMQAPITANHKQKIIKDKYDRHATLFYAQVGALSIATGRVILRKDGEVELEDIYDLEKFKPFYPDCISTTSRFVIEEPYRSLSFAKNFANEMYRFGSKNGVAFDFINIDESHYSFYKRLGYRSYKENFNDPEWGESIPLVLALHDYKYLSKIRSPFYTGTKVNLEKQRELYKFLEKSKIMLL
jgi:hypothetical protein